MYEQWLSRLQSFSRVDEYPGNSGMSSRIYDGKISIVKGLNDYMQLWVVGLDRLESKGGADKIIIQVARALSLNANW